MAGRQKNIKFIKLTPMLYSVLNTTKQLKVKYLSLATDY